MMTAKEWFEQNKYQYSLDEHDEGGYIGIDENKVVEMLEKYYRHKVGKVIFLVMVCSGQYEDYTERHIFATADKDTAEKWRDKYNRIIDNNKDRINHYYDDKDWDKPNPFCYDVINFDLPTAQVRIVEFR